MTELNKNWTLGDLNAKKRIQELVFPEGIIVDMKSRTYLTKNVNEMFAAVAELNRVSENGKEKRQPIFWLPSSVVALRPTISNNFISDFEAIVDFKKLVLQI